MQLSPLVSALQPPGKQNNSEKDLDILPKLIIAFQ